MTRWRTHYVGTVLIVAALVDDLSQLDLSSAAVHMAALPLFIEGCNYCDRRFAERRATKRTHSEPGAA